MSANMHQYYAAVVRCEAVASDHGHTLSRWYPVDERLYASLCEECGEMVWVARSGQEEGWRVGGRALRQGCPEEQLEVGQTTH
jgi:hypothetical protein